eukprot:2578239-Prymnesium_polylepis.1
MAWSHACNAGACVRRSQSFLGACARRSQQYARGACVCVAGRSTHSLEGAEAPLELRLAARVDDRRLRVAHEVVLVPLDFVAVEVLLEQERRVEAIAHFDDLLVHHALDVGHDGLDGLHSTRRAP